MSNIYSMDPRSVRTRKAFQDAFKALLQIRPLNKISVTEIAERAGFARHTFYNHYETKEDILDNLIDSVLDNFFSGLEKWDFLLANPDEEIEMYISFFQVWKENPDIVKILIKTDMDIHLIERLKAYFTQYYYKRVSKEIPSADIELAKYIIHFNAYTLLGILKPWFQDEMRYPPEVMAGFLMELTSSSQKKQAVEKYKGIFR